MKQHKRGQEERPCFSHDAAKHLYKLGYRITSDGRFSRPRWGIERITSNNKKKCGPITTVFVECSDGIPRTVNMNYAHLALLSFFGPDVLERGVRVIFKDNDPHNLAKANLGYEYPKPKKQPAEDKRVETWRQKQEALDLVKLRERPELTDPTTCGALLYAVEGRLTTLEAAAKRLNTTVGVVLIMLQVAKQQREARRAKKQQERAA